MCKLNYAVKFFTLLLVAGFAMHIAFAPTDALAKTASHTTTKQVKKTNKADSRFAQIVVDADTGKILSKANSDKQLYPASLTKMMTLYLTFEALDEGKLKRNTYLYVSHHAARQSPSTLGLNPGDTIRAENAILAVVTKSANDMAVTLAESISGNESDFAEKMTSKAHELGMSRTNFANASGLYNKNQYSSARDMAVLARAIIKNYPQYYRYFSTPEFTYNGVSYPNHNKLMQYYKGMDGLKTGFIDASGFNLVASAKRDGHRLIGVVFGGTTSNSRNATMRKLLDNGFAMLNGQNTNLTSNDTANDNIKDQVASNNTETQNDFAARIQKELSKDERATEQGDTGLTEDENGKAGKSAVQIGSFKSKTAAFKAIKDAKKEITSLSSSKETVSKVSSKKGTVYRARLGGLSLNSARNACQVLKGNCQVITAQ